MDVLALQNNVFRFHLFTGPVESNVTLTLPFGTLMIQFPHSYVSFRGEAEERHVCKSLTLPDDESSTPL
jgi:hypothetical protein